MLLLLNSEGDAYQSLQPFMHVDAELEEPQLCVWEEKQISHQKENYSCTCYCRKNYFLCLNHKHSIQLFFTLKF